MAKVIDKGLLTPKDAHKLSSGWEIRTMIKYLKKAKESKNNKKKGE